MRKFAIASTFVLCLSAVAFADEGGEAVNSILFMDIRDNTSANQLLGTPVFPYSNGQELLPPNDVAINGGGAGDGQVLRLSPVHTSGANEVNNGWPNNDLDGNSSTGKLWLYMTVNDDAGGTGDVVSSIGVDFNVVNPAAPKNTIASLSYAWSASFFDGNAPGSASAEDWTGAKAVQVPVSGTPAVYDTAGALVPSATPYRVGTLTVTAGVRNCTFGGTHYADSTYNIFLVVNNLLITRTFETGADADGHEDVALGYEVGAGANGPDLTSVPAHAGAGVNGSVDDATSSVPDGVVRIGYKGDFGGDGRVSTLDIGGFNAAVAASGAVNTLKQHQAYFGDFTGDRRASTLDQGGFNAAVGGSPTCP
jgi:hypothetical protein